MTESHEPTFARMLANKILDRPYGDPDDDLAVLSRQLLRADEKIAGLEATISVYPKTTKEVDAMEQEAFLRGRTVGEKYADSRNPSDIIKSARAAALEEAAKIANCDCPIGRETRWCGPRCQRQTSIAIRDIANADNQH